MAPDGSPGVGRGSIDAAGLRSQPSAVADSDQATTNTRGRISSSRTKSGAPPSRAPHSSASRRFSCKWHTSPRVSSSPGRRVVGDVAHIVIFSLPSKLGAPWRAGGAPHRLTVTLTTTCRASAAPRPRCRRAQSRAVAEEAQTRESAAPRVARCVLAAGTPRAPAAATATVLPPAPSPLLWFPTPAAHTAAWGSVATGLSSALGNTRQPSLATTTAASTTNAISSFSASCTANSDIGEKVYRPLRFPQSGICARVWRRPPTPFRQIAGRAMVPPSPAPDRPERLTGDRDEMRPQFTFVEQPAGRAVPGNRAGRAGPRPSPSLPDYARLNSGRPRLPGRTRATPGHSPAWPRSVLA